MCFLGGVVLLVALPGIWYLAIRGVPDGILHRVESRFGEKGIHVEIEHLYLRPFSGWHVGRIALYARPDDTYPVLVAEEMTCSVPLRTVWNPSSGSLRLDIHTVLLRWVSANEGQDSALSEPIRLDRLALDTTWNPEHIRMTHWSWQASRLAVEGQGFISRDPDVFVEEPVDGLSRLPRVLDAQAERVRVMLSEWHAIDMQEAGQSRIQFEYAVGAPDSLRAEVRASGGSIRLRDTKYDAWELEFRADESRYEITRGAVQQGTRRLMIEGQYDRDEASLTLRTVNDLPPDAWHNLLPDSVQRAKKGAGIQFAGDTKWDLTIGPSPLAWRDWQIVGHVMATEVDAHGVWMDDVSSKVRFRDLRVELDELQAHVGRGAAAGPAAGRASYDLETRRYEGAVKASFDPHAVLPVAGYSRTANRIIKALSFSEHLPEIDVLFSGVAGPDPTFHFEGTLRGDDLVYYGAHVQHFDAWMHLSNQVLRIDPLYVRREEGELHGWYEHDFDRSFLDMDVHSEVNPRALGRIAGGAVERILSLFRFEGPVSVDIAGRVDYGAHQVTDYRAVGKAERVGWQWITADRYSMEWIALGDEIVMNDVQLDAFGGEVTGSVTLREVGSDTVAFSVAGMVSDVEFARLLSAAREDDGSWQGGRLSGHFALSGWAEEDWRNSLSGGGRVRIRDGQVFQIPVLGGLSDILKRIDPRLGFAVQTDARAVFEVADRRMHIEDIRVEGNLLSLRGRGEYHLDGDLDFSVQVQPLRRGWLVDAVRVVTYPVSRLLQLRLRGTLSNPSWGIENLPREWWPFFEKETVDE